MKPSPKNKFLMVKPLIFDFNMGELTDALASIGEPTYRATQIWKGIYQSLWTKPDDFTNLSRALRSELFNKFSFNHLDLVRISNSTDGETQKILYRLPDDQLIETVRMRYEKRLTLCVSTQSGCAMGCTFCATGQMGYHRNLTSGEIVEQVINYARSLKSRGEKVTNVVFMGMGEPLHNYDNVMDAIDRLNHPEGMKLGARRFTISTVGLVPAIHRLTAERRQSRLAVSLHAADDELRSSMLPVNNRFPIRDLFNALHEYAATTKRRITFEWALIQGVNDTPNQAEKLASLVQGMLAHVNLIPLNPTAGYKGRGTTHQQAEKFKSILENRGIPCTIRLRRGIDIQAGCGQLASREL